MKIMVIRMGKYANRAKNQIEVTFSDLKPTSNMDFDILMFLYYH
jgi:hypothetical protein